MTVTLTLTELASLAASVGFPDPDLAAAVAMAESGGDPNAHGDTEITPGGSLGLWQINLAAHPMYQDNPECLYDPTTNAQAAYAISNGGTNWHPWSTYNSGAYKKYYDPRPPGWPSGVMFPVILALAGGGYLTHTWWMPLAKRVLPW